MKNPKHRWFDSKYVQHTLGSLNCFPVYMQVRSWNHSKKKINPKNWVRLPLYIILKYPYVSLSSFFFRLYQLVQAPAIIRKNAWTKNILEPRANNFVRFFFLSKLGGRGRVLPIRYLEYKTVDSYPHVNFNYSVRLDTVISIHSVRRGIFSMLVTRKQEIYRISCEAIGILFFLRERSISCLSHWLSTFSAGTSIWSASRMRTWLSVPGCWGWVWGMCSESQSLCCFGWWIVWEKRVPDEAGEEIL